MKTLIKVVIIASIIFFGISIIGKNSPPSGTSTSTVSNHSDLLNKVRKEPKVIEAVVTDVNVLYVSVLDDGTRRDGYAEYLCQSIAQFHTKVDRVKVVKHNSLNDPDKDNAYGVLLGESWCR